MKLSLFDHAMCGYTYVPLQSFETPGHLVQLWQSKRELGDMKFVQILQKLMQGRESTIFCNEGTELLDSGESPLKKAILDMLMTGKLSARARDLRDMQQLTTSFQVAACVLHLVQRLLLSAAPWNISTMPICSYLWVSLGQAWAMGMICNSS